MAWQRFARQQDAGLQYRCAHGGNVVARYRHSACRRQANRANDRQLKMGRECAKWLNAPIELNYPG